MQRNTYKAEKKHPGEPFHRHSHPEYQSRPVLRAALHCASWQWLQWPFWFLRNRNVPTTHASPEHASCTMGGNCVVSIQLLRDVKRILRADLLVFVTAKVAWGSHRKARFHSVYYFKPCERRYCQASYAQNSTSTNRDQKQSSNCVQQDCHRQFEDC